MACADAPHPHPHEPRGCNGSPPLNSNQWTLLRPGETSMQGLAPTAPHKSDLLDWLEWLYSSV